MLQMGCQPFQWHENYVIVLASLRILKTIFSNSQLFAVYVQCMCSRRLWCLNEPFGITLIFNVSRFCHINFLPLVELERWLADVTFLPHLHCWQYFSAQVASGQGFFFSKPSFAWSEGSGVQTNMNGCTMAVGNRLDHTCFHAVWNSGLGMRPHITMVCIDGFHGAWLHFRRVRVRGLCLVQLCAKYRLISATLSPYYQCRKIKEATSLKVKGPLYSCLLIVRLPFGSRTLNWDLETIYRSNSA